MTGGALIVPKGLLRTLMGRTGGSEPFGSGDRKAVETAAMDAVMRVERQLGYDPVDVSAAKKGYDVESRVPESMRKAPCFHALRQIEVKGRAVGASTVTVTKNEILTALNAAETFILAVVEVDGQTAHTVYLKCPFASAPDFSVTSVNYDIRELIARAEVLYRD